MIEDGATPGCNAAIEALISWLDDFVLGQQPAVERRRSILHDLHRAAPAREAQIAGELELLTRHEPVHISTGLLLAIEHLRQRSTSQPEANGDPS